MPGEEPDLSFAEFTDRILPHLAVIGVPKRFYTAPAGSADGGSENAPGLSHRGRLQIMERETGFPGQRSCYPKKVRSCSSSSMLLA